MRLVAKGIRELRWGPNFWLFAARYYLMPWYGWRASLSMKWNAATPAPVSFRLSNILVNYALLVFQIIITLLWIRSVAQAEWWLIVLLSFPMATNLIAIVFRLQMVFKFGHRENQIGG